VTAPVTACPRRRRGSVPRSTSASGRELRQVVDGRQTREQALQRYAAFCDEKLYAFHWLLRVQDVLGRAIRRPVLTRVLSAMDRQSFIDWSFGHYLRIAPPEFALASPVAATAAAAARTAAA
jgi:hypothetical protein